MMIPVILSGGSGTRLWPLSRELYPKQFLPLTGERTMLQMTVERLRGLPDLQAPLIICNEEHRFLVAEQLRQMGADPGSIILEPIGRNTAPAVALAALHALGRDPDAVLLVLPADHVVTAPNRFQEAVLDGLKAANDGALVTFGIVPSGPEVGYGYIKKSNGDGGLKNTCWSIERFVEKPPLAAAEEYVASGDYLWNSGMFLFRADRYLAELAQLSPDILTACRQAYETGSLDKDFLRVERDAFLASPSDSIDYAVMEKTDRAVVVPLNAGWNDVGSWASLSAVCDCDEDGNVVLGDVLIEDTCNSYLRAEERLLATVGVVDHIVVETADAVLVAHKDKVQDVKRIVERLKAMGRSESSFHKRVYRPWGSYEGVAAAERFQVKRIVVKPGASLSLQMHHHRAEHWIVVRGTAKITRGDDVFMLSEDQSTYIPIGVKHRLANPGMIPLEIIEVQSGSYLGEDDIVRFEDVYGRSGG
ncbi:MAG: mannose-1-phosphate guanylyltransferase/mannose-6-phosphate isomerase [Gammaproteobacteria bacterium]